MKRPANSYTYHKTTFRDGNAIRIGWVLFAEVIGEDGELLEAEEIGCYSTEQAVHRVFEKLIDSLNEGRHA